VAEAVGGALWSAALRISDGALAVVLAVPFPGEAAAAAAESVAPAFEASLLLLTMVEGDEDVAVSSFMDMRASDRALKFLFLLMPPLVLLVLLFVVVEEASNLVVIAAAAAAAALSLENRRPNSLLG